MKHKKIVKKKPAKRTKITRKTKTSKIKPSITNGHPSITGTYKYDKATGQVIRISGDIPKISHSAGETGPSESFEGCGKPECGTGSCGMPGMGLN